MNLIEPPLPAEARKRHSFLQDFALLLKNQIRVSYNSFRQRPFRVLAAFLAVIIISATLLIALGMFAYGALRVMNPQTLQGFLSLLFMTGISAQIFFGVTSAFVALYMSEDLELLLMTPVSLHVVFAVKSLSVFAGNLLVTAIFIYLPGLICGLLFGCGIPFYLLLLVVGLGLCLLGTAAALLINLVVMRLVPSHRSKEAVGLIGAFTGILIALVFQLPSMLVNQKEHLDLNAWLNSQEPFIRIMEYFPWGWGSASLLQGIAGNYAAGILWCLLLLGTALLIFIFAFTLVEKGFRRGYISLSQGEGGRRSRQKAARKGAISNAEQSRSSLFAENLDYRGSTWAGIWAIAKKDLLVLKRDTREWFALLIPLILMAFFIGQYLFFPSVSSRSSLITILIMYTIMFSGNMALRAFGREGESDWLLNSVPLAGWPVVWGKLISSVLPTLVLMEALLVGTAWAVGISQTLIYLLVPAVVLLSLGSSAIGLYYSINYSRYNPDKPQVRIAPGASLLMYIINLIFVALFALGCVYLFPPPELLAALQAIQAPPDWGGDASVILNLLYLLSRPVLWPAALRIICGIMVAGGAWLLVFIIFMAATVRQSKKGFRVALDTGRGRNR